MRYSEYVKPSTDVRGHNQRLANTRAVGDSGGGALGGERSSMEAVKQTARRIFRSIRSNYGGLGRIKRRLAESEKMSRYQDQMAAHNSALTALFLGIAVSCAEEAQRGTFLNLGSKCAYCPHAIEGGGCNLRLECQ